MKTTQDEEKDNSISVKAPIVYESVREVLWQPKNVATSTTTITEVTDQNGVTVVIREINDISTSAINRPTRFLGYGHGGRGGRH